MCVMLIWWFIDLFDIGFMEYVVVVNPWNFTDMHSAHWLFYVLKCHILWQVFYLFWPSPLERNVSTDLLDLKIVFKSDFGFYVIKKEFIDLIDTMLILITTFNWNMMKALFITNKGKTLKQQQPCHYVRPSVLSLFQPLISHMMRRQP